MRVAAWVPRRMACTSCAVVPVGRCRPLLGTPASMLRFRRLRRRAALAAASATDKAAAAQPCKAQQASAQAAGGDTAAVGAAAESTAAPTQAAAEAATPTATAAGAATAAAASGTFLGAMALITSNTVGAGGCERQRRGGGCLNIKYLQ